MDSENKKIRIRLQVSWRLIECLFFLVIALYGKFKSASLLPHFPHLNIWPRSSSNPPAGRSTIIFPYYNLQITFTWRIYQEFLD